MSLRKQRFIHALSQRQAVKIIAGITNTNLENIHNVISAANEGGAHAVDVAAETSIVKAVRGQTDRFVFASATELQPLLDAVEAGADGVEVGNYDALYDNGIYITSEAVLALAQDLIKTISNKALISVTIPGHLAESAQVTLAQQLEALGVDIIQTEGAVRLLDKALATAALSADEKAAVTLHNTAVLAAAVSIPVMAATGLHSGNITAAFAAGASAVGIGSAVNKLTNADDMTAVVREVVTIATAKHTAQPVAVAAH